MAVLPPGVGTGFTSVGDYLDSNQGTLAREGSDIGGAVGGQIDAARGAADLLIGADSGAGYAPDYTSLPGYKDALDKAIAAKDETTALGSPGGVSDYFQRHLGDSRSQGDFDASLLGASGRLDVSGLQNRGGGLIDYLNHGLAGVQPPAPTTPPRRETEPPQDYPARPGAAPGTTLTPNLGGAELGPPPGNPNLPGRQPRRGQPEAF